MWSPRPGSNRRPLPYQGSALPAELRGRDAVASRCLQCCRTDRFSATIGQPWQIYASDRGSPGRWRLFRWEAWWAGRESNPHSRRRLIYSQRSSPPAQPTHESASARGAHRRWPMVSDRRWRLNRAGRAGRSGPGALPCVAAHGEVPWRRAAGRAVANADAQRQHAGEARCSNADDEEFHGTGSSASAGGEPIGNWSRSGPEHPLPPFISESGAEGGSRTHNRRFTKPMLCH